MKGKNITREEEKRWRNTTRECDENKQGKKRNREVKKVKLHFKEMGVKILEEIANQNRTRKGEGWVKKKKEKVKGVGKKQNSP